MINATTPLTNIKSIYCFEFTCYAISNSKELYAWGNSGDYVNRVRIPSSTANTNVSYAKKITTVTNVEQIVVTDRTIHVLNSSGAFYSAGSNLYGGVGIASAGTGVTTTLTLSKYTGGSNVSNFNFLSAGLESTIGLRNDGTVWGWGKNEWSQLGLGTQVNVTGVSQVKTTSSTYLTNIKQIEAYSLHVIALNESGEVYGWGNGLFGKLGNGTTSQTYYATRANISDVKEIVTKYNVTYAIKNDGTVWGWGYRKNGSIPVGNMESTDILVPTQLMINESTPLSNIRQVGTGDFSYAITNDGKAYIWGGNLVNLNEINTGFALPLYQN